jgi:hypothetical protein
MTARATLRYLSVAKNHVWLRNPAAATEPGRLHDGKRPAACLRGYERALTCS